MKVTLSRNSRESSSVDTKESKEGLSCTDALEASLSIGNGDRIKYFSLYREGCTHGVGGSGGVGG